MRCQLVLQFTAEGVTDFDELIAVEERLIEQLNDLAFVDGHDFGESEFNLFVLTNNPVAAFEKAERLIQDECVQSTMRAAFRERNSEKYVILWPPTLIEFSVK